MFQTTLKAYLKLHSSASIRPRPCSRSLSVMTKSKLSQGELVQNCLVRSPAPLIDVGVNLVDHSFDKVSSTIW